MTLKASLFSGMKEKQIPCRTRGCGNTWTWRGDEQLRWMREGKTDPPLRMCVECYEKYTDLEEKEILERLRVVRGDLLYMVETPEGIELTPYNPEFAEQMEVAERVMRQDRDALRKLAE